MSFVIVWKECTAPYNKDGLSISWLWRVGDYEAEDYIMIIIILLYIIILIIYTDFEIWLIHDYYILFCWHRLFKD